MHLKVDFAWKHLECVIPDEESGDEPYLWTFFLTVDGDTVKQVTEADGKPHFVGTVAVKTGPGSHGNLGAAGVKSGRRIDIAPALGAYSTTLKPIRIDVAGQTVFLPGRVVAVAALLEEDATPDEVMDNSHESVRKLVEVSLNDFVNTFDLATFAGKVQTRMSEQGGTLVDNAIALATEEFDAVVDAVRSQVPSVIELEFLDWHTPGFLWEYFNLVDPDDRLGYKTKKFNERTLVNDVAQMHQDVDVPFEKVDDGVIESSYDLGGRLDAVLVRSGNEVIQFGESLTRTAVDSGEQVFEESRLCVERGDRAAWTLYEQSEQESYMLLYPFLDPVFKIADTEISGPTVSTIATCGIAFFDPAKPSGPGYRSESRVVTIHVEQFSQGQLKGVRLSNTPADGRYGVPLEVGVRPGGGDFVSLASYILSFDGLAIESEFYDGYKRCMEKFRRPSDQYAKSKRVGKKDLWGPSARERFFQEQMRLGRELVEAGEITRGQLERARLTLPALLRIAAPQG